MLNTVVLMGRLSDKPELRKTSGDLSVTSFTIAVDRYTKPGQERQTNWIDCVAWRQTADFITTYFDKGSMIAVTGSLQTRMYTDKNGNNRKAVEVVVDTASFCGSKRDGGGAAPSNAPGNAPDAAGNFGAPQSFSNGADSDFEEVGSDDDLPF